MGYIIRVGWCGGQRHLGVSERVRVKHQAVRRSNETCASEGAVTHGGGSRRRQQAAAAGGEASYSPALWALSPMSAAAAASAAEVQPRDGT